MITYKSIVEIKKKLSEEMYIKYLENVIKILLNNKPIMKGGKKNNGIFSFKSK